MSRLFDADGDKLAAGTDAMPVTGTLALWLYPTWAQTDGVTHPLFMVAESDSPTNFFYVQKNANGNLYIGFTGYRIITGTYTLLQNAWNLFVVDWTNAGATHAFLNNVSLGTDAGPLSPWNSVGKVKYLGWHGTYNKSINNGRLAEVALWSRVLTSGERGQLFTNLYSPNLLSAVGRLHYWSLNNNLNDWWGTENLTDTGTAEAAHPAIVYSLFQPATAVQRRRSLQGAA